MTPSATLRRNMAVAQLFPNWVQDKRVLEAMYDIPREQFVPADLQGSAYADQDLALGNGRSLLAPLTLARLLESADIKATDNVLVVGGLTGYVAAVVSELSDHVAAIDSDEAYASEAANHYQQLGITHVTLVTVKSLADGHAASQPYDAIILCGAVQTVPQVYVQQLKVGGRIAMVRKVATRPGKRGGLGKGTIATRIDHTLQLRDIFDVGADMLPGFESTQSFTF